MEIIELCQYPGLPKTRLMNVSNLSWKTFKNIIFSLIDQELIEVETRDISYSGQDRVTDYFIRTSQGDDTIVQFKSLREKLSIEGAPSKSK